MASSTEFVLKALLQNNTISKVSGVCSHDFASLRDYIADICVILHDCDLSLILCLCWHNTLHWILKLWVYPKSCRHCNWVVADILCSWELLHWGQPRVSMRCGMAVSTSMGHAGAEQSQLQSLMDKNLNSLFKIRGPQTEHWAEWPLSVTMPTYKSVLGKLVMPPSPLPRSKHLLTLKHQNSAAPLDGLCSQNSPGTGMGES